MSSHSESFPRKTALFVASRLPGRPLVALLSFGEGQQVSANTLFVGDVPPGFKLDGFELVAQRKSADYVLIPHAITKLDTESKMYLDQIRAEADGMPVIVFVGGDLSHDVFIDDMIVLKGSQYKYLKRPNEIIVPPFVEDAFHEQGNVFREKESRLPVVGFCGWAVLILFVHDLFQP